MTVNKRTHGRGRRFKPSPPRPIKKFHVRWGESLGLPNNPYMKRYLFNLWLFSIRIHVWYAGDDTRYMHDHAFDFFTFVLKGGYTDVTENGSEWLGRFSLRYRKAEHLHFVSKPINPTITLLLCFKPKRKWGFKVNGKMMRPLRYFSRYGHEDNCK
jgi:hypothetical protein